MYKRKCKYMYMKTSVSKHKFLYFLYTESYIQ